MGPATQKRAADGMVVEGSKPCNCDHPHMEEPGAGVAWSVAIGPGSWREQHLQPPNGKMVLEHHLSGGTICGWKTLTRWELWSEVSSTGCSSMRSERVDRSIDMKAQEPVPTRDTLSTPATLQHDSETHTTLGRKTAGVENTLQQDTAHIVLEGESSTHIRATHFSAN